MTQFIPAYVSEAGQSSNRAKIAFLNRCYWPDTEATGQLLEHLATHLADRYDVTVVAGQPNINQHSQEFSRTGVQIRNGVRIERLKHTKFHKRSIAGRLINLSSFTLKARTWGRRAPNFDVIISETDPFFLPLVAAPMAKRMGAKFIAYLQDVYPDIGIALGIKGESVATRALRRRLCAAYASADRIVVLDSDMRDRLVSWGLPRDKFVIIPNWTDTDLVQPVKHNNPFRARHGLQDRFVVMHSGNMGLTQRLDCLVAATSQPDWPVEAVLLLVGGGARQGELRQQVQQLGVADRVRFLPYQPLEKLGESLSAADIQVISMDGAIRGCMAPSKLYGILAAGTATLGIVPQGGSIDRLIRRHEVGISVCPNDPCGFVNGVRQAMSDPGQLEQYGLNGRQLALAEYDSHQSCQRFEQMLDGLLPLPTGRLVPASEMLAKGASAMRPHGSLTEPSLHPSTPSPT